MKFQHLHHLNNRENWLKSPVNSGKFRSYLIGKGSLTMRLQLQSQHFSVTPLRLRQAKALQHEAALLALKAQQHALQRDVLLVCDGVPVVFAHSVLPNQSLRGDWRGLGRLGSKPLGAILFANPKVQRTPLTYKKLSSHNHLYQLILRHSLANNQMLNQSLQSGQPLWARRSVFSLRSSNLGQAKILVTEVFLPAILKS
ncbi:MAG: chorismate lyase [Methylophilaceae bacterium]|nr:chorismate lyase [Methylophilaceae bacterium]